MLSRALLFLEDAGKGKANMKVMQKFLLVLMVSVVVLNLTANAQSTRHSSWQTNSTFSLLQNASVTNLLGALPLIHQLLAAPAACIAPALPMSAANFWASFASGQLLRRWRFRHL